MTYVYGKLRLLKISKTNVYNQNQFYFQEHFYLFNYKNEIRDKIIQYKFQEKSYLYKTFSKLFIEDSNFNEFISKYDCITCVPIHKKRYKTRGYNQSELIAKEISKIYHIPLFNNLLIKQNNIVAQSTLNKKEREKNIKNAFSLNLKSLKTDQLQNLTTPISSELASLNIAIIDDIFTTGSTANECAKVLSHLGFGKIGIITIAKD